MPASRLRVANPRVLLLSLCLVVATLVWRACASPTHLASTNAGGGEPTINGHDGGDALRVDRVRTNDAGVFGGPFGDEVQRITDAEAKLARIEAKRAEGQHDEQQDALEIRTLVSLHRIGAAHAKLQHFAERYPTSGELPALVRLTGYHPRPMNRHAR